MDGPEAAKALSELATAARRKKRARDEAFASRVRMATDVPGFLPHRFFTPYAEECERAFHAMLAQLGQQSDGEVSAAVSAIARSAVMTTYMGRWISDLGTGAMAFADGGDGKPTLNATLLLQGSRLLEAGRQHTLAAFHLQQLEAEARARPQAAAHDPFFVTDDSEER